MKEKILKLNDIKNTNLRTVLDILLQSDGLSRIELARKMGCDNTTVSRAVKELIEQGIVVHGEKNEQDHGRPRVLLKLNPEGPVLMGISMEAERITGVLTDLRGEIRHRDQVVFSDTPSRERFLSQAGQIIQNLKQIAGDRLSGIGTAVFGTYSGPDFMIEKAAALPSLNGTKLLPYLTEAAGEQVTVCDHLVAKMSFLVRMFPEFNTGTVMLVSSGSGIGSLIAENGRFLFSRNNHGGELGHITSIPDGESCSCGRKGCLETVGSIRALLKKCRATLGDPGLTFEKLCERFQAGDQKITEEVDLVSKYLAIAITNQLNSLPVDRLVVTGRMLELGEKFQIMLEEKINAALFPFVNSELSTHFIRLDFDNSLARGAAIFAGRFSAICK